MNLIPGTTYRFSVRRKGYTTPVEYIGLFLGHEDGYDRFLHIEQSTVEVHVESGLIVGEPVEVQPTEHTY